jgi:hypothetical protein
MLQERANMPSLASLVEGYKPVPQLSAIPPTMRSSKPLSELTDEELRQLPFQQGGK